MRSSSARPNGLAAAIVFARAVRSVLVHEGRETIGRRAAHRGADAPAVTAIEAQLERFAPGFRDLVLARSVLDPAAMEARNPNDVGGDIAGGSADVRQLFARPVARPNPYRTPLDGVHLCSSSTPPCGGVHRMGGYRAARAALRG